MRSDLQSQVSYASEPPIRCLEEQEILETLPLTGGRLDHHLLQWPTVQSPLSSETFEVPACENIASWLTDQEANVPNLIPGLEARVVYHNKDRQKTPYSLVHIHGFTASNVDLAPIPQKLAEHLGANLFLARLTAHARDADAFKDVKANDWLNDAQECLAIGEALGEKVILMGHSTGATLCTIAAMGNSKVDAVLLLSPNFGAANKSAKYVLYPWGPQLLRLLVGEYRSIHLENQLQRKFWTETYHTNGLGEMLAMVEYIKREIASGSYSCPCLCVYSDQDKVVNLKQLRSSVATMHTPLTKLMQLPGSTGHSLAGNILAPEKNEDLTELILDFLQHEVSEQTVESAQKQSSAAP